MLENIATDIADRVIATIGSHNVPAALHEPSFTAEDVKSLVDCVESSFVSSVGPAISEVERKLGAIVGADYAVAVSSGTAALQLALHVVGVQPGDEVLMPSLSFIATANAAAYLNATPHFLDISDKTLGISPEKMKEYLHSAVLKKNGGAYSKASGRRIGAIVPVHIFGFPAEVDQICDIAAEFDIPVVEDAAEALGSSIGGRMCGSFGATSAISFNGNKLVTSGGGGVVLTNDPTIEQRIRYLATTARSSHKWEFVHDEIGYNFRMPALNASLLSPQLDRLNLIIEKKRSLAEEYQANFADFEGGYILKKLEHSAPNFWLNCLVLNDEALHHKNHILEQLHQVGILARPAWLPLHNQSPYREAPKSSLDVTATVFPRLITLPSSPFLGRA